MKSKFDVPVSRRGWLGAGAALAAAPLLPSSLAHAAAGKLDAAPGEFRLGVATYSLRKFDRARTIEFLKELKVETVSVKEFHAKIKSSPEEWAAARKDFEAAGLRIVSCGNINFHVDTDEECEFNFKYAQALGAEGIVMAPKTEIVPRIEKFVKKYNIKAYIHNHGPEDKYFPTPQSVLKAVKNMDPRMGVCIDVGHTTRTGTDVVQSIREAGPRLLDFHIKDLGNLMDAKSQVAVGEGSMPVVEIFKTLRKMKYTGNVNLEYEIKADDPFPGMRESFAYMRGVLAALRSA